MLDFLTIWAKQIIKEFALNFIYILKVTIFNEIAFLLKKKGGMR